MQKHLLMLLVAMLAISTAMSQNYDFTAVAPSGQTLYYKIVGYSVQIKPQLSSAPFYSASAKPTGNLIIPNSVIYGGYSYPVTSIGYGAFCGCDGLTVVSIPNSITNIESHAFDQCTSMSAIDISSSVISIGDFAFQHCSSLTSVVIPSVTIGSSAFALCNNLTSITLTNSVTTIGSGAFAGCTNITEIISHAQVPPSLGNVGVFDNNLFSSAIVRIPCGSICNYQTNWSGFSNYEEDPFLSFSVSTADSTMGTVLQLIQLSCQSRTVAVFAEGAVGFCFDHWSDGNTENPRALTPNSDTSITAFFVTQVMDTCWLHDTIFVFDTIHDTVYITQESIDGAGMLNAKVYSSNGQIVVEGAMGNTVTMYDVNGRMLATREDNYMPMRFDVPVSGTYMIKIGNYPARKVVVIR